MALLTRVTILHFGVIFVSDHNWIMTTAMARKSTQVDQCSNGRKCRTFYREIEIFTEKNGTGNLSTWEQAPRNKQTLRPHRIANSKSILQTFTPTCSLCFRIWFHMSTTGPCNSQGDKGTYLDIWISFDNERQFDNQKGKNTKAIRSRFGYASIGMWNPYKRSIC